MKATIQSPMWPSIKFLFDSKLSEDNLKLDFMRTIATTGFPRIIDGVRYKTLSDDPDKKQE